MIVPLIVFSIVIYFLMGLDPWVAYLGTVQRALISIGLAAFLLMMAVGIAAVFNIIVEANR